MTARFMEIAFTPAVRAAQAAMGSREAYARREVAGAGPDRLGEDEAAFIASRDSFYMATVSETGWPYLQHRGGPPGFVKVLDERTLGIADFRGNRQYVSLGNLAHDDRAALFFMDYARRARLKVLARVEATELTPDLAAALANDGYPARAERGLLFKVEAFDWNCPQHITPRFSASEVAPAFEKLEARIAELEGEIGRLKA